MKSLFRFRHLSIVIVFLGGLGLMGLIPPLQSPDEPAHLTRAYMLSTGQLSLSAPTGRSSGGYIDPALQRFYDLYQRLEFQPSQKVSAADTAAAQQLKWTNQLAFAEAPGTGYYLPLIYLPQAFALRVGRILYLSVPYTYALTRGVTFLCVLIIIALAFRFTAPSPMVLALIALPMTLFQLVSSSIDGLALALTLLLLSIFSHSVRTQTLSRSALVLTTAAIVLVTTSRPHMLPLVILPLFLIQPTLNRWILPVALCTALCTAVWLSFAAHNVVDIRVIRDTGTAEGIKYYVLHPQDFIQILCVTVVDPFLILYYRDSFIGLLGWLDTRFPQRIIQLLWALLLIQGLLSARLTMQSLPLATVLGGLATASYILVFFLLLVSWTGPDATTIQGVQGRYFILPAMVVAYGFTALDAGPDRRPTWLRWAAWIALLVFGTIVASTMPSVLLDRYFG